MWRLVDGPTSATIATLLDYGWDPREPWAWESDIGQVFTCSEQHLQTSTMDWSELLTALNASIHRRLWWKASRHICGSGLEAELTSIRPNSPTTPLEDAWAYLSPPQPQKFNAAANGFDSGSANAVAMSIPFGNAVVYNMSRPTTAFGNAPQRPSHRGDQRPGP